MDTHNQKWDDHDDIFDDIFKPEKDTTSDTDESLRAIADEAVARKMRMFKRYHDEKMQELEEELAQRYKKKYRKKYKRKYKEKYGNGNKGKDGKKSSSENEASKLLSKIAHVSIETGLPMLFRSMARGGQNKSKSRGEWFD